MNKILPIITMFLFLVSCQDVKRTPKPEDLIPQDKMVDVLTELSLLHGARSYNQTLMENKGIDPYPYLMEKFKIDSSQLARSNRYYAEHAGEYQEIYERVKENLETLLASYDSIRELEEIQQDSIRAIEIERDSIRRIISQDSLPVLEEDTLLEDDFAPQLVEPVQRRLPGTQDSLR